MADRDHRRSVAPTAAKSNATLDADDSKEISRQVSHLNVTEADPLAKRMERFDGAPTKARFELLCDAVRGGELDFICAVLDKDKEGLINQKGEYGDTLLHWAILSGQDKVAIKLVSDVGKSDASKSGYGADVNICGAINKAFAEGHTPLHLAASQAHEKVLKALASSKTANLNCRTSSDETPLHKAAGSLHKDAEKNVKRLLEMTADINAVDNFNNTALHHGAYAGNLLVVRRLMEAGAQRGLENKNKQKPEQMAKTPGIAALINELSPDREDGWNGSDDDD